MTVPGALAGKLRKTVSIACVPLVEAPAADKAALKTAFDSRAAALTAAKAAGTLGETTTGLLAVPAAATADAATLELLKVENTDRQALFVLLAAETSATTEVVAERYARRAYQEAMPGASLQKKDGTWAKK